MKTLKNIAITVGSGIVSFMYIIIWTMIFCVTGVLLMIDWVHHVWTDRRIPWITVVTDGCAELFAHPFSKRCDDED